MSNLSVEHVGILVEDPVAMAEWYRDVLGFKIRYSGEDPELAVAFIVDRDERVMLELARLPDIKPLSDMVDNDLQLHISLRSDDPDRDMVPIIAKGARFIEKCSLHLPGDYLIVLRDPWGNSVQLVKRATML